MDKYADLLLKKCLNINNQSLVINAPLEAIDFIRILVKKAYELNIKDIYLDLEDKKIKELQLNLQEYKNTYFDKRIYNKYALKNACFLFLVSYSNLNSNANAIKYKNRSCKLFKSMQNYNKIAWVIAPIPTKEWNYKLFKNYNVKKLWNVLYKICLINDNPIKNWENQIKLINKKCLYLNNKKYKYIKLKSKFTDLTIKLPKSYLFVGANTKIKGKEIIGNMPSYEVYTAPLKYGVNGIVYNTKPLVYQGHIIDKFYLIFKHGKVIKYDAKIGKKYLNQIFEYKNSKYLGELALVENNDITKTKLLYYETLLDENASIHLALGNSYKECTKYNELVNHSDIHVDFMIGSNDLIVYGINDTEEIIIKNNQFCINKD